MLAFPSLLLFVLSEDFADLPEFIVVAVDSEASDGFFSAIFGVPPLVFCGAVSALFCEDSLLCDASLFRDPPLLCDTSLFCDAPVCVLPTVVVVMIVAAVVLDATDARLDLDLSSRLRFFVFLLWLLEDFVSTFV